MLNLGTVQIDLGVRQIKDSANLVRGQVFDAKQVGCAKAHAGAVRRSQGL